MAGRPRKELPLPTGLRRGQPVKVTGAEVKGIKLGLIYGLCKYDSGIEVQLTNPTIQGVSEFICIQTDRGDTIESVEVNEISTG